MCHDLINSFKCACSIGFTGSRCQTNIDDCVSSPCRNGGICHDSIAGYTCECPPGFTGKFLSLRPSDKFPNTCIYYLLFRPFVRNQHQRLSIIPVPTRRVHRRRELVHVHLPSGLHRIPVPNSDKRVRIQSLPIRRHLPGSSQSVSVHLQGRNFWTELRDQRERMLQQSL